MPNKQTVRFVSAKQFGAQGDGVHNDAIPIQAALNNSRDFGGYKETAVVLEPGTYLIPAGTTITVPDGVTLQGSGDDSKIQIGINVPTANHTAFSVGATASAIFENLQFVGPANPNGRTIRAVEHAGTSGTLSFIGVTATGTAGTRVGAGARFLLDLSNDIETTTAIENYTYLGDWVWVGGNQPRIIKQIDGTAPDIAPGYAAPEGSLMQQFVSGAGVLWVKTGALDTDWATISNSGTPTPGSTSIYDKSISGYGKWFTSPPAADVIYGPVDQVTYIYVLSDEVENVGYQDVHGVDPTDDPDPANLFDGRDGTNKLLPLRSLNGVDLVWGDRGSEGMRLVVKLGGAVDPSFGTDPATVLAAIVGTVNDPWDGVTMASNGTIHYRRQIRFRGSESWKVTNAIWGPRQMRVVEGPWDSTYAEDITAASYGRLKIFFNGAPTVGVMFAPGNFLRITRASTGLPTGGREVYAPMPICATFPEIFPNVQAVEVNCNLDSATFLSRQINTPGLEDEYKIVTPAALIVANVGPQNTPTPNDGGLNIDVTGAYQIGDETLGGTFYGDQVWPHLERLSFLNARVQGPLVHDNCLWRNSFGHIGGAMRVHNAIYSGDVQLFGEGCPTSIDSSYSIAAESVCRRLVISANPAVSDPAYYVEGEDFMCTGQLALGGHGQKISTLIIRKGIRCQNVFNSFFSGFMMYAGCILRQIGGHTILDSSGTVAFWNKGGTAQLVVGAFGNLQFLGNQIIRSGFAAGITYAALAALGPPIIMAADPSGAITYDILTNEPAGY